MKSLSLLKILAPGAFVLMGIGSAPLATAGGDQHTKPLHGFGTLQVVPPAGAINCLAPDQTVVAQFPAAFDALARYSGLGRTTGVILSDACAFNPGNGTLAVTGIALQTAANGDEVHAPFVGEFRPDFSFSLDIEVVGGTGRFNGACGQASGGGSLDPATGAGQTYLSGWISTVGSNPHDDPCE